MDVHKKQLKSFQKWPLEIPQVLYTCVFTNMLFHYETTFFIWSSFFWIKILGVCVNFIILIYDR